MCIRDSGMDEQAAAHAIEAALLAKGMLLHPLVSVLAVSYTHLDVYKRQNQTGAAHLHGVAGD